MWYEWMISCEKIDVSERPGVKGDGNLGMRIICHIKCKFEHKPKAYRGCHDLMMKAPSLC